jgi:hypothetical protein
MQSIQINNLTQNDNYNAFMKVLKLWKGNIMLNNLICLLLKDVVPATKDKLSKNFTSTTWLLCGKSFHRILKNSMSQKVE